MQGSQEVWLVIFGRCLFGYALYQVAVRLDIILFNVSRPEHYAADYSKIHIYQNIGVIAGSFVIGFLTEHFSPSQPFFIAMIGFLITAVLLSWAYKNNAQPEININDPISKSISEPQTNS